MKYKNSGIQGNSGIGAAIAWFTSNGYTVSIPLTDTQNYDLVVEIDNRLNRIQVKTTNSIARQNGRYTCDLRTQGGNRSGSGKMTVVDSSTADILFIVTGSGVWYLIPVLDVEGNKSLTLGNNLYDKYVVSLGQP